MFEAESSAESSEAEPAAEAESGEDADEHDAGGDDEQDAAEGSGNDGDSDGEDGEEDDDGASRACAPGRRGAPAMTATAPQWISRWCATRRWSDCCVCGPTTPALACVAVRWRRAAGGQQLIGRRAGGAGEVEGPLVPRHGMALCCQGASPPARPSASRHSCRA